MDERFTLKLNGQSLSCRLLQHLQRNSDNMQDANGTNFEHIQQQKESEIMKMPTSNRFAGGTL